jgi:hypothetical protein
VHLHSGSPSVIVRVFVRGALVRLTVQTRERQTKSADKLSTDVTGSNCLFVSSHRLCARLNVQTRVRVRQRQFARQSHPVACG